jgi:hypothetical protein
LILGQPWNVLGMMLAKSFGILIEGVPGGGVGIAVNPPQGQTSRLDTSGMICVKFFGILVEG